ncbi:MAG: hypothetical protein ACOZIN_20630 [Myxococcota bacterium]
MRRRALWVAVLLAGCEVGGPVDSSTFDPQLPPAGDSSLKGWLQNNYYQAWRCEQTAHDPAPPSPHGRNRVCHNDLLVANEGSAELPVDVASVQELVGPDGLVVGFTVSRKVRPGTQDSSWYWYERVRFQVYVDGEAVRVCSSCHSTATGDFVFSRATPAN